VRQWTVTFLPCCLFSHKGIRLWGPSPPNVLVVGSPSHPEINHVPPFLHCLHPFCVLISETPPSFCGNSPSTFNGFTYPPEIFVTAPRMFCFFLNPLLGFTLQTLLAQAVWEFFIHPDPPLFFDTKIWFSTIGSPYDSPNCFMNP